MTHCGTLRLETGRLVLRRFTLDDAEAMFRNWASDPEVTKYLTWPTHRSTEDTKAILHEWVSAYGKKDFYQWAITLKENGDEPIGGIAAVKLEEDRSCAEIGYCIGRSFWRRGITSEALQAVIGFFFDRVGAKRIEARHDPRNPHSGAVMRKCGMQYEGTLRRSDRNNQGICDACVYAILKTER